MSEELWKVAMDAWAETADKNESIKDAWQRVVDRVLAATPAGPPDKTIVAAAKALALDHAEVCNVNYDDLWKLESESFMVQARLALGAARAALSAHQPEAK